MHQLNPIELTENQEAFAARIEEILSPKAAVVTRHVSRLLASKKNSDLLGATEFLIRDAVHRLGMSGYKLLSFTLWLLWFGLWDRSACGGAEPRWPANLPVYDHIVIVMEENKDYDEVIGQPDDAPYINNVLKAGGANLTKMFAEEHKSEGNYFWLFSGSNQQVGFDDAIPDENNRNYPFKASNLGFRLLEKGRSFKGYCENLSSIDSTEHQSPDKLYARKHAPWVSFGNLPLGRTVETSCHLRFADFPTDPAQYHLLPTVAIVVPNLINDMHNGPLPECVTNGDSWLKQNFDPYYQWAKQHHSLLIVTFDENEIGNQLAPGLTNPFVAPQDPLFKPKQNRIPTILAGARIKPGDYEEGKGVTHVNLLRTLEAMYGLPKSGAQQPHAAAGGIADDQILTDIFQSTP